jgi:hypothetical protein
VRLPRLVRRREGDFFIIGCCDAERILVQTENLLSEMERLLAY